MDEKIVRVKDLIKILGVSRSTIWSMEKDGDIPPSSWYANGRIKGWKQDDVRKILSAQKRRSK